MTDEYYGYTATPLPSSIAQYDDYTVSMGIVDYQPTAWDDEKTTIDMMWPWIKMDSDARATALADMWRRVHTLLDNTGAHLRRYTDALAENWKSDASKVFLERVGAALHSIEEWKQVANTNATGLDVLASTISYNQSNAKRVYLEYVKAINEPGSVEGSRATVTYAGRAGQMSEKEDHRKQRMQKKYTEMIKPYVKELGDTYLQVYFNYLTWGTTFKGPTDAVIAVPPTLHKGGPPGHMPPPPILPPAVFPHNEFAKLSAELAQTGQLPTVDGDHALTLAGMTGVPTMPPPPQLPTVTGPGPGVPSLTGLPGLPGMPGMPGRPGMPGVGPGGMPRVGTPSELNARLAGEQSSMMRPQLPGRPNLSGMRPPAPGQPRPPMPGRGNPNLRGAKSRLPGATGPDLSEEMRSGPRSPMTPRLGGRRGGPAGHMGPESERLGGRGAPPGGGRGMPLGAGRGMPPGGGRGMGRPSDDAAERLAGRRRPGMPLEEQDEFRRQNAARPALEGRTGAKRPAGPMQAGDTGHSPALRGRGGESPIGGRSNGTSGGQRQDQHGEEFMTDAVAGQDELWAVERPSSTVIDTPQLPPPATPGPAIGRS
jgi:hypothetical protein